MLLHHQRTESDWQEKAKDGWDWKMRGNDVNEQAGTNIQKQLKKYCSKKIHHDTLECPVCANTPIFKIHN